MAASSTADPVDLGKPDAVLSALEAFQTVLSDKLDLKLAVLYRFSPEYDSLWNEAWEEYDKLEEARAACGAPRQDWQEEVEAYRKGNDEMRSQHFIPHRRDMTGKDEPLAHSLHLFEISEVGETTAIDRLHGWKTARWDWDRFCELYKSSPRFRQYLSPPQQASFLVLDDWWNSRYSPKRDMDAFRASLEELAPRASVLSPTVPGFPHTWTSHSHYHSAGLELFMREFHPMEWEPYACRTGMLNLMASRRNTIGHAIKMRFAYAAFNANVQSSNDAPPAEYPRQVRDMKGWNNNLLFMEPPTGDASYEAYMAGLDAVIWPPRYLWDVTAKKTVRVADFPRCPDYVCVSHTWGRWCVRPPVFVDVTGVPWQLKENTLYDVRDVPDMLLGLKCEYVWLDLFCLPQDDTPEHHDEVANQTAIFRRAKSCVAWLNDVNSWEGTTAALNFIGLMYLQEWCNHEELVVSDECLQVAHAAAASPAELLKPGSDEPSSWFSSLWTLQEAALCPNLLLCSKTMEILVDGKRSPISLSTLFSLLTDIKLSFGIPLSKPIDLLSFEVRERPLGAHNLDTLAMRTRLHLLLSNLSPIDIMINSNLRTCKRSRAVAIMSALDVLDWYIARKPDPDEKQNSTGDDKEQLVLDSFPLEFVREAARKFGSSFFMSLSRVNVIRLSTSEGLRGLSLHVGSMMPFTNKHGWFSSVIAAVATSTLRPRDHESVGGWTIKGDGSVRIRSAGILASSEDPPGKYPIESIVVVMERGKSISVGTHVKIDLRAALRELEGKSSIYYAITLSDDFGLQFGVVLQTPKIWFPLPGKRYLMKVGVFRTLYSVEMPSSTEVNWSVV